MGLGGPASFYNFYVVAWPPCKNSRVPAPSRRCGWHPNCSEMDRKILSQRSGPVGCSSGEGVPKDFFILPLMEGEHQLSFFRNFRLTLPFFEPWGRSKNYRFDSCHLFCNCSKHMKNTRTKGGGAASLFWSRRPLKIYRGADA